MPLFFVFPLPAGTWRLTSRYGWRIHPIYGDRRFHDGLDLAAPQGTPVFAAADGLVVGRVVGHARAGNYLTVRHDGLQPRITTEYLHLSAMLVPRGTWVRQGQIIGLVGSTGRSTGPHLHFRVKDAAGHTRDPLPLLGLAADAQAPWSPRLPPAGGGSGAAVALLLAAGAGCAVFLASRGGRLR